MSNSTSIGRVQKEVLEANTGKPVDIVLVNGEKISCTIVDFDKYSLLVSTNDKVTSLIFKHGILYLSESQS